MSTDTSDYIISLQHADIYQDDTMVLSDVNFNLHKGEFLYLVGRTGSGKSSLLKTLYADLPLQKGVGAIAGVSLPVKNSRQVSDIRRRIGIIFQDFQLLFDRNVFENLRFVLKATGWTDSGKIKNRITEVLMLVGLQSASIKMPHQLSGGEQQRIAIARALLNEPLVLLADEPTGNLDPEVGRDIMKLFWSINRSGTAIVLATHNLQFINEFPAPAISCENGKLIDPRSR
jgi:cell division transport system ATP-binding protein